MGLSSSLLSSVRYPARASPPLVTSSSFAAFQYSVPVREQLPFTLHLIRDQCHRLLEGI